MIAPEIMIDERIKLEKCDEVEAYHGSYECLICSESVRGTAALLCSACASNPFHTACVEGFEFVES